MILFQRRTSHFCWNISICCPIRENMRNETLPFSFLAKSPGWPLGQSVTAGYWSGGELMPAIQMLTKIYTHVEWWFSASKWSACYPMQHKQKTPFLPLGLAEIWACSSHSLCFLKLASLQPSVFVPLTQLIKHRTLVFCVCSGKLCAFWGVLMIYWSKDSSLRNDVGGEYLCENLKLWQILTLWGARGGSDQGNLCNQRVRQWKSALFTSQWIRLEYRET